MTDAKPCDLRRSPYCDYCVPHCRPAIECIRALEAELAATRLMVGIDALAERTRAEKAEAESLALRVKLDKAEDAILQEKARVRELEAERETIIKGNLNYIAALKAELSSDEKYTRLVIALSKAEARVRELEGELAETKEYLRECHQSFAAKTAERDEWELHANAWKDRAESTEARRRDLETFIFDLYTEEYVEASIKAAKLREARP